MKIFCVEGTLVATARIGGLELHRLLVVRDRKGGKQVAVDPVGCKPGDWVIACGSSAAREAAGHKDYPSDLTIVGIIDYWDEEEGPGEERSEEPELLVVESGAASPNGGARR
ncbi:MAG: carboxysome peptide A [Chloroflexota bacterium]|nr:carboxysome peptide A [Chloroflexota bacterium]